MIELYFMRHAESTANELGLLAGKAPYPLSENGKKQARRLAEMFVKNYKVERLVSSPLVRAVETARPFARLLNIDFAAIELEPLLEEQEIGIFTGKSHAEAGKHPDYQLEKSKRWNWQFPGGESYATVARRVQDFFTKLRINKNWHDTKALVITHSVTMRLIYAYLHETLPKYPSELAKNGEFYHVFYDLTRKRLVSFDSIILDKVMLESRLE